MEQPFLNRKNKIQRVSLLLSIATFFITSVIGYFIDLGFEEEEFTATALDIFLNNLSVCFIFIIGIFTFGIVNFLLLSINGIYLGSAINYYVKNNSFEEMLLIFIPHAIFEIPAILLSASIGFYLLIFAIEKGNNRKHEPLKFYLLYIAKAIIIVLVLLLIAAFVEHYVSMKIT